MERYNVLRQSYWITDQRAILMTRDRSFYSMELSQIDDFRLVKGKGSRDAMDIEGLGSAIVDSLIEKGAIRSPADIYYLTMDELSGLWKSGTKAAQKLLDAIAASKSQDVSRLTKWAMFRLSWAGHSAPVQRRKAPSSSRSTAAPQTGHFFGSK